MLREQGERAVGTEIEVLDDELGLQVSFDTHDRPVDADLIAGWIARHFAVTAGADEHVRVGQASPFDDGFAFFHFERLDRQSDHLAEGWRSLGEQEGAMPAACLEIRIVKGVGGSPEDRTEPDAWYIDDLDDPAFASYGHIQIWPGGIALGYRDLHAIDQDAVDVEDGHGQAFSAAASGFSVLDSDFSGSVVVETTLRRVACGAGSGGVVVGFWGGEAGVEAVVGVAGAVASSS